jgi:K+-transporting ATPase ATPase B chain
MQSDNDKSKGEVRTTNSAADAKAGNINGILRESVYRMDPRRLISNPVMFIVELMFIIVAGMAIDPTLIPIVSSQSMQTFYFYVAVILIVTVWFSTLSDSIAEAQIRATAESLRQIEHEVKAKRMDSDRKLEVVSSKVLKKGDIIRIDKGDYIPIDCAILEGVAMVDESLLTGESAPVRKAPGDVLIGGSVLASDSLVAKISVDPGDTYLSKLISMVENTKRPKTQNEQAIAALLLGFTAIFTIIIVAVLWLSVSLSLGVDLSVLIALYVCLLPTTIGALLPAIGISGIRRMSVNKIIAKSGKAVETAGDADVVLLDKTGTITFGNRMATEFMPLGGHTEKEVGDAAFLSSWHDDTPEGRSIIDLAYRKGFIPKVFCSIDRASAVEFSAVTRISSVKLEKADKFLLPKGNKGSRQGSRIRKKYQTDIPVEELNISKGAPDAIMKSAQRIPEGFQKLVDEIASSGDTPMAIAVGDEAIGLIRLKDQIKPGIKEKIESIKVMGIRPVMITGDQPLTAKSIASEVGINEFVSQAKPETKIDIVKKEEAAGMIAAMVGDGTNDAPALAAADVGLAMGSGTVAAKEAANLVDLESNPAKIIDVIILGKQLLMTRGAVTTFSIANDVAKYFAIVPVMFAALPALNQINVLGMPPETTVLAALIFNAAIIPALIPLATRGVKLKPRSTMSIFLKNTVTYGIGGVILPFIGIELIGRLILAL